MFEYYVKKVISVVDNDLHWRVIKDVIAPNNFFSKNLVNKENAYKKDKYFYAKYLFLNELDVVPGDSFEYQINQQGFRGKDFDEFDKNNINILFGGCSQTLGAGLPEENTWYKKLSDKVALLHEGKKVDFYNISVNGASIELIVKNTITFIKKGNKPEYIFLFLPESSRAMSFNKDKNKFELYMPVVMHEQERNYYLNNYIHEDKLLINFILLSLLEEVCISSGIKLLWTTWERSEEKMYINAGFNNFFKIDENLDSIMVPPPEINNKLNRKDFSEKDYQIEIKKFNNKYNNKNNEPYWSSARDGLHFGSAASVIIAENFFKEL
jgi:hypothetical protein